MESWEALNDCIGKNSQAIAKRLGVSLSLVYRWQQSVHDYSQSGAHNPLDRIEAIVSEARERGSADALLPIKYLAQRFDLAVFALPRRWKDADEQAATAMLRSVAEFGELAAVAADALADGNISREERSEILREGTEALEALVMLLWCVERECPVSSGRVL